MASRILAPKASTPSHRRSSAAWLVPPLRLDLLEPRSPLLALLHQPLSAIIDRCNARNQLMDKTNISLQSPLLSQVPLKKH
jgi:hypothetical protein